jgi:hypothetical protein
VPPGSPKKADHKPGQKLGGLLPGKKEANNEPHTYDKLGRPSAQYNDVAHNLHGDHEPFKT